MTELQAFVAMLVRAGIGHGTRTDHNPRGTAVIVEAECQADFVVADFMVTEFSFDADGKLKAVECYPGDVD